METDLSKVLQAITSTMPCEKCPYPCKAKGHASQASCDKRWFEILSNMNEPEWAEVHDKLLAGFASN